MTDSQPDEDPSVDIHKPKPWRGIREFLKEYLIIVVGVLTALGAEQGVEWLHWRHQLAEARETLNAEMGRNIDRLSVLRRLEPCVSARLDDVRHYLTLRAAGDRSPPPAEVGQLLGAVGLNTNAWESSKAGQLIAHMPPAERERYSRLYAEFDFAQVRRNQMFDAFSAVQLIQDAPMLDANDWSALRQARIRAQQIDKSLNLTLTSIIADGEKVVGKRPPDGLDVRALNHELCRSWYPASDRGD